MTELNILAKEFEKQPKVNDVLERQKVFEKELVIFKEHVNTKEELIDKMEEDVIVVEKAITNISLNEPNIEIQEYDRHIFEEQIHQLKDNIMVLKEELQGATLKFILMRDEHEKTIKDISLNSNKIKDDAIILQNKYNEKKKELKDVKIQLKTISLENDINIEKTNILKNERDQLQVDMMDKNTIINDLNKDILKSTDDVEKLKKDLDNISTELTSKRENIEALNDDIKQKELELTKADEKDDNNIKLKTDIEELEKEKEKLLYDIKQKESDIDKHRTILTEKDSKMKEYETQIESQKLKLNSLSDEYYKTIDKIQENDNLLDENTILKNELEKNKEKLEKANLDKEKLNILDKENTELLKKLTEKDKKILNAENNEKKTIDFTNENIKKLNLKISENEKKYKNNIERMKENDKLLEKKDNEINQMSIELTAIRNESEEKLRELRQNLIDKEAKILDNNNSIEILHKSSLKTKDELSKINYEDKNKFNELNLKIKEDNKKIEDLENENKELKSRYVNLSNKKLLEGEEINNVITREIENKEKEYNFQYGQLLNKFNIERERLNKEINIRDNQIADEVMKLDQLRKQISNQPKFLPSEQLEMENKIRYLEKNIEEINTVANNKYFIDKERIRSQNREISNLESDVKEMSIENEKMQIDLNDNIAEKSYMEMNLLEIRTSNNLLEVRINELNQDHVKHIKLLQDKYKNDLKYNINEEIGRLSKNNQKKINDLKIRNEQEIIQLQEEAHYYKKLTESNYESINDKNIMINIMNNNLISLNNKLRDYEYIIKKTENELSIETKKPDNIVNEINENESKISNAIDIIKQNITIYKDMTYKLSNSIKSQSIKVKDYIVNNYMDLKISANDTYNYMVTYVNKDVNTSDKIVNKTASEFTELKDKMTDIANAYNIKIIDNKINILDFKKGFSYIKNFNQEDMIIIDAWEKALEAEQVDIINDLMEKNKTDRSWKDYIEEKKETKNMDLESKYRKFIEVGCEKLEKGYKTLLYAMKKELNPDLVTIHTIENNLNAVEKIYQISKGDKTKLIVMDEKKIRKKAFDLIKDLTLDLKNRQLTEKRRVIDQDRLLEIQLDSLRESNKEEVNERPTKKRKLEAEKV